MLLSVLLRCELFSALLPYHVAVRQASMVEQNCLHVLITICKQQCMQPLRTLFQYFKKKIQFELYLQTLKILQILKLCLHFRSPLRAERASAPFLSSFKTLDFHCFVSDTAHLLLSALTLLACLVVVYLEI